MLCRGLHWFANPANLIRILFPTLPQVAPCCVRGGVSIPGLLLYVLAHPTAFGNHAYLCSFQESGSVAVSSVYQPGYSMGCSTFLQWTGFAKGALQNLNAVI